MTQQQELPNTVRGVLLGAIKGMEARGWIRQRLSTRWGVCLDGALHLGAFGTTQQKKYDRLVCGPQGALYHQAFDAVRDYLQDHRGFLDGVVSFNDGVCPSKDEALAVLRGTLDRL